MAADEVRALSIEVVYAAAPHDVRTATLQLPAGSVLADAVRASGLLSGLDADAVDALQAGIWGRNAPLDTRLRDGDRVELTRGLRVDPKEARRQRYRRDGLRRAKPGTLKSRGNPTR
jgi:putative ubiquitin-RnfH superfamily antitoxin RatB of RatAB toxin-antitoxin module